MPSRVHQGLDHWFLHLRATGGRSQPVEQLMQRWRAEAISAGTFKNRMCTLRRLAAETDKHVTAGED